MNQRQTEILVGMFMALGFCCFATVAIKFGSESFFSEKGYVLTAQFGSISGLKEGAPVEIAGVEVGRVQSVSLKNGQAFVEFFIHSDVKIEEDSMASIRTKGIIGEKYVKISPGAEEEFLEAGGEISETESVVDIEELIGKFVYGK